MSYRALYRKYRPRLFSDIVGQQGLVQALRSQVESSRISHAYLFSGPRGTGKTSAAKVLARAINCMNPQRGEACGRCRACVELQSDTNMDVVEIDAASNNSVDRVREMLDNVKYMPAVGKYRVYIVDEVHMLSTSAFNALLKTLEEPPAHVVFILATTEPHKLPATVLSRCQQFLFKRISVAEMTSLLKGVLLQEGAEAEPEALAAIARAADGGMRDALSLLDQCLSLSADRVTKAKVLELLGASDAGFYFDISTCILQGDAGGAVDLLDGFLNSGGDIKTFAADLCRHMRDLYIASYVKDPSALLDVSEEDGARYAREAARQAPGDILKALGILSELEGGLRYAANPRVLAELGIFRCCRMEKAASYEALLSRIERLEARLNSGEAAAAPQPARPAPQAGKETAQAVPPAEPQLQPAAANVMEEPPWDMPTEEPPMFEEPVIPAPFEPEQEGPAQEPPPKERPQAAKEAAGEGPSAQKLWQAVLEEMKKQPACTAILGFAQKGKGTALSQDTLTVTFSQDDRASADMLSEGKRADRIRKIIEELAGKPVTIKLDVSAWSPAEQRFIDQSRAVIPKEIPIIVEKD